jgi:hypothetical protein
MNRLLSGVMLALLPIAGWAIDATTAREIAERAAGCGPIVPCETRVRFDNDKWVTVVSIIHGYRDNGKPIMKPGSWIGITIDQQGKIVDKLPGV